jgi:hypothetical protein
VEQSGKGRRLDDIGVVGPASLCSFRQTSGNMSP